MRNLRFKFQIVWNGLLALWCGCGVIWWSKQPPGLWNSILIILNGLGAILMVLDTFKWMHLQYRVQRDLGFRDLQEFRESPGYQKASAEYRKNKDKR